MKYFVIVTALLLCSLSSAYVTADTNVFIHPNGNDSSARPTSASRAMRSLSVAHDYLKNQNISGDVSVCIAPGFYQDQQVRWTYYPANGTVTFKPSYLCGPVVVPSGSGYALVSKELRAEAITDRPVFDGSGTQPTGDCWAGGAWFYAVNPRKLHFFGLRIQNYQMAIYLRGDSGQPPVYGENVIEQMLFERIGTLWVPQFGTSAAAVDIVHSSGNVIRSNEFVRIENLSEPNDCGSQGNVQQDVLIHALYIAHESTDNHVIDNKVAKVSGAPIKFRDVADRGIIRGNAIAWSGPYRDNSGGPYAAILDRPESDEGVSCDLLIEENSIGPGYYETASSPPVSTFVGDDGHAILDHGDFCGLRGTDGAQVSGNTALTGDDLRFWYESLETVDCADSTYQCPPPPVEPDPEPCGGNTGTICP